MNSAMNSALFALQSCRCRWLFSSAVAKLVMNVLDVMQCLILPG
jgi:hypothetical protein